MKSYTLKSIRQTYRSMEQKRGPEINPCIYTVKWLLQTPGLHHGRHRSKPQQDTSSRLGHGYYQERREARFGEDEDEGNRKKRQLVQPLRHAGGRLPKSFKDRTTRLPSNPTSGYVTEGNGKTILKRQLRPHVPCSVIYNSQGTEVTEVFINRRMDKENAKMYLYEIKHYSP